MEQNKAIANRLKEVCAEKGMSYNDLADKTGIPLRRIQRLAMGCHSNPGVFLMLRICEALEISLDEFFKPEKFENRNEYRIL